MAKRRIRYFTAQYKFLSNFYPSSIRLGRHVYPTAEHLFQFLKTTPGSSWEAAIRLAGSPQRAKVAGRLLLLPVDWDDTRVAMMRLILRLKFQDKRLVKRLKATGTAELIEGNTWHDNFWGNCTCKKCEDIEGKNRLGKLLMELRTHLSKKKG